MQAQSSQRALQRSPSHYSALVDPQDSDDGQLQSGDEDDNGLEELGDGIRNGKRKRPISVSYVDTLCSSPPLPLPVTYCERNHPCLNSPLPQSFSPSRSIMIPGATANPSSPWCCASWPSRRDPAFLPRMRLTIKSDSSPPSQRETPMLTLPLLPPDVSFASSARSVNIRPDLLHFQPYHALRPSDDLYHADHGYGEAMQPYMGAKTPFANEHISLGEMRSWSTGLRLVQQEWRNLRVQREEETRPASWVWPRARATTG